MSNAGRQTMVLANQLRAAESDAERRSIAARIPGTQLRVLPPNQMLSERAQPLPGRAALVLVDRVAREAFARLVGISPDAPDLVERLERERRQNLSRWFSSVEWSPDASVLSRLLRRGRSQFDAHVDIDAQRVIVAEREHPLPSTVAAQIDPAQNLQLLRKLRGDVIDLSLHESVVRDLTQTIPTPALTLTVQAGVLIHVVANAREVDRPPARMRALFGEELAAFISPRIERAVGQYSPFTCELKMHASPGASVGHPVGTARHELCHAIDHALGAGGRFRSEQDDFVRLYHRTLEDVTEQRHDGLLFPTPYAGSQPVEFFAEAAAIFLGRYFDDHVAGGGAGDVVFTREDLRRDNPPVYDFLERLFTSYIPTVVKRGRVQHLRPAVGSINRALSRADEEAAASAPVRLFTKAWMLALRGAHLERSEDLRAALACARQLNPAWRGWLRLAPDPMTAELAQRIQSHLRKL